MFFQLSDEIRFLQHLNITRFVTGFQPNTQAICMKHVTNEMNSLLIDQSGVSLAARDKHFSRHITLVINASSVNKSGQSSSCNTY